MRNKDFLNQIKPEFDFDISTTPKVPDYHLLESWVAHPNKYGNQFLIPNGKLEQKEFDIDVFYIHPTGFFGKEWNSDTNPKLSAYEKSESHITSQVSAFNNACNIYAPEYRQATYYSFYDLTENGYKAQDLAYQDIENAFDYYLENFNNKKPFFIASHSQGTLHAQRLIHNRIINSQVLSQFINAFLIGYIVPTKYMNTIFNNLKISTNAHDTQSIISWCTSVEGFSRPNAHCMYWTPDGWKRENMEQEIICQNPLNWKNSDISIENKMQSSIKVKSSNMSIIDYFATENTNSDFSIAYTESQDFSSKVSSNNMVQVKGNLINKISRFSSNGDLHNFDISIFWGAIRDNVKQRISNF